MMAKQRPDSGDEAARRVARSVAGGCRGCRPRVLLVGGAPRCRATVADRIRARGLPLIEASTPLDAIVHLQADDWTTSVVIAGALATADQETFRAFLVDAFPDVDVIEP